jgi:predicted DsbA family dithiol-disulfide isomerase
MSTQVPARLQVEVWSDLVCPWCYIGKRQLDRALEQFEHRDSVEVTWRSFELSPDEQTQPQLLDDYLATQRGMSPAEIAERHARVTSMAAEIGLDYRLDLAQLGNTFDGHRLIHLAADEGLQEVANERLLRAYMSEGRAISDRDTLADLAAEIGLDRAQAREALDTDLHAEGVRNDERLARELGISAVPFFVFDRTYGASGAQPSEYLLAALEQSWAERTAAAVAD